MHGIFIGDVYAVLVIHYAQLAITYCIPAVCQLVYFIAVCLRHSAGQTISKH